MQEQKPENALAFRQVPFPLHTVSHASPLEHGLHAHVPAEKFVQIPLPLQLTSHPPAPITGDGIWNVRSVLPIASAVTMVSTVRPAEFCMCGLPQSKWNLEPSTRDPPEVSSKKWPIG